MIINEIGNAIIWLVIIQALWKTESDIITWWRWSILTKLITEKICRNSVIFTINHAKYLLYVYVRVEHFYKVNKEYSFKQRTTFLSDMVEQRKFLKFMVYPSALVSTGRSSSCLCKYKSYSNSQHVHFWYGKYPMLYNYNHAIIFSMITQRFILKTEIACSFGRNTKINVFILYYIEIPALYSPYFPICTNNIEVFRSHKQIP